jgi:DNA-binding LacI/PurR family transcriptional regulator
VQKYLLGKGLDVPRDVSMVVFDDHPAFDWFDPAVSRFRTDIRRAIPRVVRWVENMANDREDRRETLIHSEFVEGGTIGPARAAPCA